MLLTITSVGQIFLSDSDEYKRQITLIYSTELKQREFLRVLKFFLSSFYRLRSMGRFSTARVFVPNLVMIWLVTVVCCIVISNAAEEGTWFTKSLDNFSPEKCSPLDKSTIIGGFYTCLNGAAKTGGGQQPQQPQQNSWGSFGGG